MTDSISASSGQPAYVQAFIATVEGTPLEEYTQQLIPAIVPAIGLELEELPEDNLPVGASKVGGYPDLPADFVWPNRNDVPLSFIAQFAVEDLKNHEAGKELIGSGLISVFVDLSGTVEGEEEDRIGWLVVRHDGADLVCTEIPEDADFIGPHSVGFHETWSLPSNSELFADIEAENDLYDVFSEFKSNTAFPNRLFGADDANQTVLGHDGEQTWRVFLRWLGEAGVEFGDQTAYLSLPESDLKAGDFSRVWLNLD